MNKLYGILILILILIASNMSFKDELKQESHYLKMACEYQAWPDFKGLC